MQARRRAGEHFSRELPAASLTGHRGQRRRATADTTVTQTMGSEPPQTEVTDVTLVREDGHWKDCTPPGKGSSRAT
jgi:hypothetical protein